MTQFSPDPSMEEILASIKRIIAEEGEVAPSPPTVRMPRAKREELPPLELSEEAPDEDVLELTRPIGPTVARGSAGDGMARGSGTVEDGADLLSNGAADASRNALSALAAVAGGAGVGGNALEGLVRELLRPMLREWLDANLPTIIEKMVAAEIARISGRR